MNDQRCRKSNEILAGLLTDPAKKHILLSIRSITVMSIQKPGNWRVSTLYNRPYREAHEKKWLLVADLLSKIPRLREFTLQGTDQLSVAVLDAIKRYHPQAHLHIQNWTRIEDDEDQNNAAELALAHSPNLRSLQARLWDTTSHIDLRQVALKRIVGLSPCLEELDISEGSSGIGGRNITPEEIQEESRMREEFWQNVVLSANSIRSLRSRGASHIKLLEDVSDISELELLDMGYIMRDFFLKHPPDDRFPHLKHFSFALTGRDADLNLMVTSFLSSCKPLETLSIRDGASWLPLLEIVLFHGNTLRTLILHDTEQASSDWPREPISLQGIQKLRQNCHVLEDITIDGDKLATGEALNDILSALAAFPYLHTIRIYLPLGVAEEAARTPHIFLDEDETRAEIEALRKNPSNSIEDSCWLEEAWSLLRYEKNKNGSCLLKELHVKVGEWEREISGGYPAGWVIWEAANRRYFVATPHERDDRPDDIDVYIKGTKPYSHVDSHEIRRIPDFVDFWDCGHKASSL